jgi:hypothetical protein
LLRQRIEDGILPERFDATGLIGSGLCRNHPAVLVEDLNYLHLLELPKGPSMQHILRFS